VALLLAHRRGLIAPAEASPPLYRGVPRRRQGWRLKLQPDGWARGRPMCRAGGWQPSWCLSYGTTAVCMGHERPGRGGQRPPRLSLARAMMASAEW
jgi:hypothetical protein